MNTAATPDQTQLVEQILEMTLALSHAAQMSDWLEAERISRTRSPLLMSLRANQSPAALGQIHRIREMTSDIHREATTALTELTAEFRKVRSQFDAAQTYLRIARI